MIPFHERRRQQFLYEQLYENSRKDLCKGISTISDELSSGESAKGTLDYTVAQGAIYNRNLWLWMLDYTAGEDLDLLAPRFSEVVDEFVQWCEVEKLYNQYLQNKYPEDNINLNSAPVDFNNQLDYEDHLQLISIAIILRDAQSMKRIVRCMESHRNLDGLYEQLIADYADHPNTELDELFHDDPYELLFDVISERAEEDQEQALMQQYLESWYKAQDGARWYNQHLKILNDTAWYYGYWAFEAGAVAYLLDLDDSALDHMAYPRDLVAYGRKLRQEDRWTSRENDVEPSTQGRLRAEPNEIAPQTGWWHSPAKPGGKHEHWFEAGQRFPENQTTDYGSVIWYFDPDNQKAPPQG